MKTAVGPVRPPAVAGLFYPAAAAALRRAVDDALAQARPVSLPGAPRPPKALIVPHAGYAYSGPVAAAAYRTLDGARGRVRRVVLVGPSHRVPLRGLALPGASAFDTPLGRVPVDAHAPAALAGLAGVAVAPAAHAREHALEVQLPFLQRMLVDFALVPLVVGEATPDAVAAVLERLWGGDETLVVVSSDLSHYHPDAAARAIDGATVRRILAGRTDIGHDEACGATPVAGLVVAARRAGLVPELLDLRTSGDTAGDRARVVGYAAIAFRAPDEGAVDEALGAALLARARAAIAHALGAGPAPGPAGDALQRRGATFVTLRDARGDLRGCIGTLEARCALADDVADNAVGAATRDPRFAPLPAAALAATRIEVSLLGPAAPIAFRDRADLAAQLRPHEDGLVLACGARRATFLPQVWDALPDPGAFVDALARKAGIAAIDASCAAQRYAVRKWSER